MRSFVGALFALCGGLTETTFAQTLQGAGQVSRIDAYGNARPWYPERRRIGQFQNAVQRRGARGFQNIGRRGNRRGAFAGFVVSGDFSSRRRLSRFRYRLPPPGTGLLIRRSARRSDHATMGNLEAIFARRIGLLEESSLRAPVTEVIHSQFAATGLSPFVREIPFRRLFHSIPAGVSAGSANAGATGTSLVSTQHPTLSGMLDATLRHERQAVAERAWTGFKAGKYRRASRAFEAAIKLNPDDLSSRVGALFCALSNNSMRTAVVILGVTARHDTSPFLSTLNVTDRYGSPALARDVRLRCELFAQRHGSPESTGLYAFVLWYLGEQGAAMGVASSLERDHPGTIFAAWRAKMESARNLEYEQDKPS